jgi:divalent metal cation (Fe/Co/Zn/Cd) transporter
VVRYRSHSRFICSEIGSGAMYLISLHAEIPETHGPVEMHEIAERAERKLRGTFGGEAVCHTDPLMERTPEIVSIENAFKEVLHSFNQIYGYHDFRVVAESSSRKIIIADIDVREDVHEEQYQTIQKDLEKRVMETIPNIAYCGFYITPKFAY